MRVFLEFLSVKKVAEHWTILDVKNFANIQRTEFVTKETPNWDRMLARSNTLSRWAASHIVDIVNFSERVAVMQKMVELMVQFWDIGNFNACMCIWGALHATSVSRLQKTKMALPTKTLELLDICKVRLSEAANFTPLQMEIDRKVLKGEPFVPWLELINKNRNMAVQHSDYLTEETFDNHPRLVNFEKIRLVGEQMLKFDKYQKVNEQFVVEVEHDDELAWLYNYLKHLPTYTDNELWECSVKCEPVISTLDNPVF